MKITTCFFDEIKGSFIRKNEIKPLYIIYDIDDEIVMICITKEDCFLWLSKHRTYVIDKFTRKPGGIVWKKYNYKVVYPNQIIDWDEL